MTVILRLKEQCFYFLERFWCLYSNYRFERFFNTLKVNKPLVTSTSISPLDAFCDVSDCIWTNRIQSLTVSDKTKLVGEVFEVNF